MATPTFRDIVPLAIGLFATALLSFALGSLTTYWAMQGSRVSAATQQMAVDQPATASLLIPVAASAPAEQVSASPPSFDPDAIELEPRRGPQTLARRNLHGESL
jgi:hypothetical protein